MVKVAKFGGTSVATAQQLQKVKGIVEADDAIRFVVPSAPGKAHSDDTKVTDLLYLAHEMAENKQDIDTVWSQIEARFGGIAQELGIDDQVWQEPLTEARRRIEAGANDHFVASRGEAIHGRLVAALLGAEFIDATEVIRFARGDRVDPVTFQMIVERCSDPSKRYVIPGFYGADARNNVRTFSRGGSDVTGALVANAIDAEVYENWTDVSGFLMTDPRVVPEAKRIGEITYSELRELAYMGASVLHEESVLPLRYKGIPINIRNTNQPQDPGTMIVKDRDPGNQIVTGIAGRKGFTVYMLDKALMNSEVGFGRRMLDVFERLGISIEHTPTGIDTMSVVVSDEEVDDKEEQILDDLQQVHPDKIEVFHGMALVATVGKGMNRHVGVAARLFTALAEAKVNIRMIDQGSTEQNIIVGVEEADLPATIRAIYDAFC